MSKLGACNVAELSGSWAQQWLYPLASDGPLPLTMVGEAESTLLLQSGTVMEIGTSASLRLGFCFQDQGLVYLQWGEGVSREAWHCPF